MINRDKVGINYNASGTFNIYILFHKFKEKIFFFSRSPLLRTLAIMDTESPPEGVGNNGSRL